MEARKLRGLRRLALAGAVVLAGCGDGATAPITSSLEYFKDEYVEHFDRGCMFDPALSTVFAGQGAGVRTR